MMNWLIIADQILSIINHTFYFNSIFPTQIFVFKRMPINVFLSEISFKQQMLLLFSFMNK